MNSGESRIVVDAGCGRLEGLADPQTGIARFLGIPFARGGQRRRFQCPEPVESWPGIRSACDFGPSFAHLYDRHEGTLEEFGETGGESDPLFVGTEGALTLNVWTPGIDSHSRPVLVFIHGGANWVGTSRLPLYHGDQLAGRCAAVVVSFNYRLGVMGFMELGEFGGAEYCGTHANGLRDQLLAIRWVQENISRFGGDPDNITLMGESAGSIDITWLMASGQLDGLCRKVILMSGVGGNSLRHDISIAGGRAATRKFMSAANIPSMERLLALDTSELLIRHRRAFESLHVFEQSMFTPRVDGEFVERAPIAAAARGELDQFSVMIGCTAFEMGLYLLYDPELSTKSYAEQLSGMRLDSRTREELIALYDDLYAEQSPGLRGMHLLSDIWYVMPSYCLAEALAASGASVWMYEFAWQNPQSAIGAAHATDLCFWFGKYATRQGRFLLGIGESGEELAHYERLSRHMQESVKEFLHAGSPGTLGRSATWNPYCAGSRSVMRIDDESRLVSDPRRRSREWWMANQDLIWDSDPL